MKTLFRVFHHSLGSTTSLSKPSYINRVYVHAAGAIAAPKTAKRISFLCKSNIINHTNKIEQIDQTIRVGANPIAYTADEPIEKALRHKNSSVL